MGEKRYIPERTIDSLFAAEVVRGDPTALIWSPSQRADVAFDHWASTGGTTLVVECKGVLAKKPNTEDGGGGSWAASINVVQLHRYSKLWFPVVYLLVARPMQFDEPFDLMDCGLSPCRGGDVCFCCPRDERSRAHNHPQFASTSLRFRWQPWFSHWAWMVPAKALLQGLRRGDHKTKVENAITDDDESVEVRVHIRDTGIAGTPLVRNGRTRLCHLLQHIHTSRGDSVAGGLAPYAVPPGFVIEGLPGLLETSQAGVEEAGTPPVIARVGL